MNLWHIGTSFLVLYVRIICLLFVDVNTFCILSLRFVLIFSMFPVTIAIRALSERVVFMSETEFRRLFARNLTYYINASGKTQSEVARALHLSKATMSSWCLGTRIPRMDKVDLLCSYFGIKRSDLMEDHTHSPAAADPLLPLSREEGELVRRYRSASDDTKSAVCAVLGVQRQENAELSDSRLEA